MKPIVIRIALAFAVAALAFGANPSPSSATVTGGQDGIAQPNEMLLYAYGCNTSSFSDFSGAKPSLTGFVFLSSGSGQGQNVKNNTECVFNGRPGDDGRMYVNSNYLGSSDVLPRNQFKVLVTTYNNNASFNWM